MRAQASNARRSLGAALVCQFSSASLVAAKTLFSARIVTQFCGGRE